MSYFGFSPISVYVFTFLKNGTAHLAAQEEEGGQGVPRQDQHHGRRARVQPGLQGGLANDHHWLSFVDNQYFFQATGQELFDLVCRTIGLRETWYVAV